MLAKYSVHSYYHPFKEMSPYLCTYASKYHFSVKDVISATTCGACPTSLRRPGIPGPTRSLSSHIRDLGSTNIYTSRPTDGKLSVLVWPINGLKLIQSSYCILLSLIADGALYDEPMGCRLWCGAYFSVSFWYQQLRLGNLADHY